MFDLNELYLFVQVVDHGGFAPASRALGIPKATLSRRIAQLETRLNVRLVQRSSRRVSVTELGRAYYQHCKAMLVEAQAAQEAIEATRAEPCGVVRLTCPVTLLHLQVAPMLAAFLAHYPRVTLHVEATNRRVDPVGEGIDLALRVRRPPLEDSDLVVRVLGQAHLCLVAAPALLAAQGWDAERARAAEPGAFADWPTLSMTPPQGRDARWHLDGPDGALVEVRHQPRLVSDDMTMLREAAVAGVGVVQLPVMMVRADAEAGRLVRVATPWAPRADTVHAVYGSRRGLLPGVRALLDWLAKGFEAG